MYNTILKIVFLSTSFAIIYLMKYTYKHTYDIKEDTFRMIFLVVPCFVLACFINYYPNPQEVRPLCASSLVAFFIRMQS